MLDWERRCADEVLADAFGFHAVQLGRPELDALDGNRMPHRWLALQRSAPAEAAGRPVFESEATRGTVRALGAAEVELQDAPGSRRPALWCEFDALPFPSQSMDLVVLPHTLESARDAHLALREVERVLVPEGRVLITGFNPTSLWGLRHLRDRRRHKPNPDVPPPTGETIGVRRLRDWLRLLSFEVEGARFGCFRPPVDQARWLERWAWADRVGGRWCPVAGGVYALLAVKRVRGMRLVGLARRQARYANAPRAVAVHRQHREPPRAT